MNIYKFFSGSLLILVTSVALAVEENSFPLPMKSKLQTEVGNLMKKYDIPGLNVGIWIPSQGEWIHSYGVSDKDTNEKMNLKNHFRIGSITKTFVVTAILQLVDQGKVSLDDPINKYIDNVPGGDQITIRQLANMTSGLASYSEDEEWVKNNIFTKKNHRLTTQELLEVAFKQPITFKAGKGWHYSNTNTILLAQVIEKISGISLGRYLEQNIFTPLGLNNTLYPIDEKIPAPYAHGYTKQTLSGNEEDATFNDPSWTNAAGQIISTFDDLKIWAKALGTGALLSESTFKERLTWGKLPPLTAKRSYGLGIAKNNGWIYHTGKLPGYNCVVAYLPEKQAVFVAMINSDIDQVINKKEVALTDLVFEAVAKIVTPSNIPIK